MLSVVILPQALKNQSAEQLLEFEAFYEKIGMPALIIQVVTGLWLAFHRMPEIALWFDFSNSQSHGILAKLTLLALTVCFAFDARVRVIPSLRRETLVDMAWHIVPVTIFSIMFVAVGVSFRVGWFF